MASCINIRIKQVLDHCTLGKINPNNGKKNIFLNTRPIAHSKANIVKNLLMTDSCTEKLSEVSCRSYFTPVSLKIKVFRYFTASFMNLVNNSLGSHRPNSIE